MKLSEKDKNRHFCGTAFIVHNKKILLVNHKKLGMWLPIGGHMKKNETPDQAVKREVKEEAGLDIEIISENYPKFKNERVEMLSRPFTIALQDIDSEHQHIDIQFVCRPIGNLKPNGTEECKWFTSDEIEELENCPDETKYFGKEAINIVKNLK